MKIRYYILLAFCISVNSQVIRQQVPLEGNNIRSFIWNTGVFNQDLRTNITPGCEWPKDSGKYLCATAGFCLAAIVNSELRTGTAFFDGEYRPGHSINGQFFTDTRFRFYKIKKGDNYINNPDWLNWGLMVPFGAPFTDINYNGIYEYYIDIPGYKGSTETIFICLTDGDPTTHSPWSGFGGGTNSLYANIGLTAWCYDTLVFKDIQFFKLNITNGGSLQWDSTNFAIAYYTELGETDNYIGSDSVRNLAYSYNADSMDGNGLGWSYGLNPPAVGIQYMNCQGTYSKLSGFGRFFNSSSPSPLCEREPHSPREAFNFIKGFKNDLTPWINKQTRLPTKFCFSGDPELLTGWTEYSGNLLNCNGNLTGDSIVPSPPGDRRLVISYEPAVDIIIPGESFTILFAQMVARGTDHKNSVTKLKQLSDSAKALCQNGFVIGINQLANEIPTEYKLFQNYPNPFNPVTKIKFSIPKAEFITIKIYDALGREISTLVNDRVIAGVYSVEWNASSYPSGVYFCRFESNKFSQTNKMILLK